MLEVDSELELDVDIELENSLRLNPVALAISTVFVLFQSPATSLSFEGSVSAECRRRSLLLDEIMGIMAIKEDLRRNFDPFSARSKVCYL